MAFLLLYVTHPDKECAHRITETLVRERLAACGNIFSVESMYEWQGAFQREGEWVSLLKTRPELEQEVESVILLEHPYDTPCVMRIEARANAAYEQWIYDNTRAPQMG